MRRAITILAITLLTAGCSTTSSTPKAPASSSPTVDKDTQFLTAVRNANIASWAINAPNDPELLAYPPKWCAALTDGHSVSYILNGTDLYPVGMSWGTKKPDAVRVLVIGVTTYCPSQRVGVVQQLQASGDW